jgi:cytochrome c2
LLEIQVRARSLRWLAVLGFAAIVFGALGYSVAQAQVVEKVPDEELPAGVKNAGANAPAGWTGTGEHPGKPLFDQTCGVCHSLGTKTKTGPGLKDVFKRVADSHPGDDPYKVIADYVERTVQGGPDKYDADPYFRKTQEEVSGPGVQMATRGNLPATATRRDLLTVIDYIFRFRESDFDEAVYLKQVKTGRNLVSGRVGFKWGGPSCTGCHTIGADPDLRGANLGPNVAHTYVLARKYGTNEKLNYADGLYEILSGEHAPAAHFYYKDEEGSHPLTQEELVVVNTFFEQAARDTGTEQDSNYLPIFALLAAALCILLLEPGILNILFVKEDHEFVDGPYKLEDHHPSDGSLTPGHGHGPSTLDQHTGANVSPEVAAEATKAQAHGSVPPPMPAPKSDHSTVDEQLGHKPEDKKEDKD